MANHLGRDWGVLACTSVCVQVGTGTLMFMQSIKGYNCMCLPVCLPLSACFMTT